MFSFLGSLKSLSCLGGVHIEGDGEREGLGVDVHTEGDGEEGGPRLQVVIA